VERRDAKKDDWRLERYLKGCDRRSAIKVQAGIGIAVQKHVYWTRTPLRILHGSLLLALSGLRRHGRSGDKRGEGIWTLDFSQPCEPCVVREVHDTVQYKTKFFDPAYSGYRRI
jgi:hypothetical protein